MMITNRKALMIIDKIERIREALVPGFVPAVKKKGGSKQTIV